MNPVNFGDVDGGAMMPDARMRKEIQIIFIFADFADAIVVFSVVELV